MKLEKKERTKDLKNYSSVYMRLKVAWGEQNLHVKTFTFYPCFSTFSPCLFSFYPCLEDLKFQLKPKLLIKNLN